MAPTIIFVNGLPATGKSTLAEQLGHSLGLPVFGKDQFKELLYETLGWSDRDWSRKLGAASMALLFQVLEQQLIAGQSCIVESNFHPVLSREHVKRLNRRFEFNCVQMLCVTEGSVLLERYHARVTGGTRHPGHLDSILETELATELQSGRVEPMDIGGTLIEIDTTHFGQPERDALCARLAGLLAAGRSSS